MGKESFGEKRSQQVNMGVSSADCSVEPAESCKIQIFHKNVRYSKTLLKNLEILRVYQSDSFLVEAKPYTRYTCSDG